MKNGMGSQGCGPSAAGKDDGAPPIGHERHDVLGCESTASRSRRAARHRWAGHRGPGKQGAGMRGAGCRMEADKQEDRVPSQC